MFATFIATGSDGSVLIGECKWGTVGSRDVDRLKERARHLASQMKGIGPVHLALFSGRGMEDDGLKERARRGEVLYFSAEDLYA